MQCIDIVDNYKPYEYEFVTKDIPKPVFVRGVLKF